MENINLIALSGKIGSGKNTVAKIIQYLYCKNNVNSGNWNQTLDNFAIDKCIWQQKAFATKLKQIVSILTGIPVEDLEKQEVKNRLLGEDWIRYGFADGFWRHSDGNTLMHNKECSKERYEEEFRTNWQTAYKTEYTPRILLQYIGTDLFRDKILENIWCNALFADYKNVLSKPSEAYYSENNGLLTNTIPEYSKPNWIITDLRFPNEFDAIKLRGGICVRINRDDYFFNKEGKRIIPTSKEYVNIDYVKHESEIALDNHTFDYVLNNNGTIDDLVIEVKKMLEHYKII